MQVRTICSAALLAASAACSAAKPHTYGAYNELAPRVSATKGERAPQHVTVDLNRAANVAVFFVIPGRGIQMLYPIDSTQSAHLESGTHTLETSVGKAVANDSSRLTRRPNQPGGQPAPGTRQQPQRGRFDPNGPGGINSNRGYLLVYATSDPLPYAALSTKVNGISIPIDDDDALNTVTKLIRETVHGTGAWAAYANEVAP